MSVSWHDISIKRSHQLLIQCIVMWYSCGKICAATHVVRCLFHKHRTTCVVAQLVTNSYHVAMHFMDGSPREPFGPRSQAQRATQEVKIPFELRWGAPYGNQTRTYVEASIKCMASTLIIVIIICWVAIGTEQGAPLRQTSSDHASCASPNLCRYLSEPMLQQTMG